MRVHSKLNLGDALGVDIKVMNKAIPEGILKLDPQICTYAWVTGISDWAFLNFIKQGREIERGATVALLDGAGEFWAGKEVTVIKYQPYEEEIPARPADPGKPKSKPKAEIPAVPEETWVVESQDVIEQMFTQCGKGQTKEEKEARLAFIHANATKVDKKNLTKQRIQFVNGTISREEQLEASRRIGHDVSRIVYANQEDYWPKEGGIRFPTDTCVRCAMRGICLNNSQLRDTLVVRSDEDWDVRQEETQE